jgi:hypothetical protein
MSHKELLRGFCKGTFPLVGRTCADEAKIRGILKGLKFVSLYSERGKKNLKKMDFWFWVYAQMIEGE